jgi:hypothetical protein
MAEIDSRIDIHFLVGHMDPVQCDHMEHGQPKVHHSGPARYYVKMACPGCGDYWPLFAVCKTYVDFCLSGGMLFCKGCRKMWPGAQYLTVVSDIT